MLPSLIDRLHIFLGPQHVDLIRYGRGFKPKEIMRANAPCHLAESNEPVWMPAIEAFKKLMLQQEGKADVFVSFSNHFAQYLLVQSQEGLSTESEEEAYVKFCFSEIYGKQTDHFFFRWSSDLSIDAQVASAVDQDFLNAIDQVLEAKSMSCRAIQPSLMAAYNLMRNRFAAKAHWFVFVEHGCVLIAFFEHGVCSSIRRLRVTSQWKTELPSLLTRAFNAHTVDTIHGNILICVPEYLELRSLPLSGWNVELVQLDQILLLAGQFLPVGISENSHEAA